MITLPNNCRVGSMAVFPSNWKTVRANVSLTWRITYRFYDDNLNKKKQVVIKGMNQFRSLSEKQSATRILLEDELKDLEKGFNPIVKKFTYIAPDIAYEIEPDTPFPVAMLSALDKLSCVKSTRMDIKSTLKYISIAAVKLKIDSMPIRELNQRHLLLLLEQCSRIKSNWSNNTFNAYKKNMSIVLTKLKQLQAIERNPAKEIDKLKHATRRKKVLTQEQCIIIDEFTKKYDLNFWRLINIFFHSGARTTEIFKVQGEHVNLEQQTVSYLVLKGKNYKWIDRPIKDIALPFWREAMKDCKPSDFVFGKGLKPGPVAISPIQAGRRWKRHIKAAAVDKNGKETGKLGIDCDWYSLKFLNTTQSMDVLENEREVMQQTGHTSTAMIVKIYDTKNKQRKDDKLKRIANNFAG